MKIDLDKHINEAIKLEIKMYKLYTFFQETFIEDSVFWRELAKEEQNHIVMLRKIKPFLPYDPDFSNEFFSQNIESIIKANNKVNSLIKKVKQNANRNMAFKIAVEIENSASELHYQIIANKEPTSKLAILFQRLNLDDNDHAKRIENYFQGKKK